MCSKIMQDLLFIIFVILISGLLGFLIAWFCKRRKLKKQIEECEKNTNKLKKEISELKKDISKKDEIIVRLTTDYDECKEKLKKYDTTTHIKFDSKRASQIIGKNNLKQNDLQIIDGIGPKIEKLLKDNGIETWYKLSKSAPENIKKILVEKGGEDYNLHNPQSWPKQAKYAYEGQWHKLAEYLKQVKNNNNKK